MTILLELTSSIRDTAEAITMHERAIAADPSSALTASLRSLQKRLKRLQAELAEHGDSAGSRPSKRA